MRLAGFAVVLLAPKTRQTVLMAVLAVKGGPGYPEAPVLAPLNTRSVLLKLSSEEAVRAVELSGIIAIEAGFVAGRAGPDNGVVSFPEAIGAGFDAPIFMEIP